VKLRRNRAIDLLAPAKARACNIPPPPFALLLPLRFLLPVPALWAHTITAARDATCAP